MTAAPRGASPGRRTRPGARALLLTALLACLALPLIIAAEPPTSQEVTQPPPKQQSEPSLPSIPLRRKVPPPPVKRKPPRPPTKPRPPRPPRSPPSPRPPMPPPTPAPSSPPTRMAPNTPWIIEPARCYFCATLNGTIGVRDQTVNFSSPAACQQVGNAMSDDLMVVLTEAGGTLYSTRIMCASGGGYLVRVCGMALSWGDLETEPGTGQALAEAWLSLLVDEGGLSCGSAPAGAVVTLTAELGHQYRACLEGQASASFACD